MWSESRFYMLSFLVFCSLFFFNVEFKGNKSKIHSLVISFWKFDIRFRHMAAKFQQFAALRVKLAEAKPILYLIHGNIFVAAMLLLSWNHLTKCTKTIAENSSLGLYVGISENDMNTFTLHLLYVHRISIKTNASSPKNSLFRFVATRAIERSIMINCIHL